MKLLKIDDGRGQFSLDGMQYSNITDIVKEDILKMLELIYNNDVILDKCENDKVINNNAEKIIYESLYSKLTTFISNKDILKSQIDDENSSLLIKYKKH